MRRHLVLGSAVTALVLVGSSCGGSAGSSAGRGGSGAGGARSSTSGSAGGDDTFIDAGDGDGAITTGCSDAAPEPPADAATGCEGLAGGIAFKHDVAPIFNLGCNGEQCHAIPTWKGLVSQPSHECCDRLLVTPGDPTHSYLVDKITGAHLCSGDPMPLGRPALSMSDTTTILRWICEGAPDD